MDPFATIGGATVARRRALSGMQRALRPTSFAIKILVPIWNILSVVVECELVAILNPAVRPETQRHQIVIPSIAATLQHVDRQIGVTRVVDEMRFVPKLAGVDRVSGLLFRVVVKVKEVGRASTILHLASTLRLLVRDDLAYIPRDKCSRRNRFFLIQNQSPSLLWEAFYPQRQLSWPLSVVPGATRTASTLGVALPQELVCLGCDPAILLEGNRATVIDDQRLLHTAAVSSKSTLSRCT